MRLHFRLAIAAILMSGLAANGGAALFEDDFEGNLSDWTGQGGGAHSGTIVADPLNPGNQVLAFTALGSAGDIFTSQQIVLTPGETYQIAFDYLGLPSPAANAGNLGGFAGLSEDLPGRHLWYFATSTASGASDVLVDDGQWASYVYEFTAPVTFTFFGGGTGNSVHLMFEDFGGSGGVAGDVYFDNVRLSSAVPEPASGVLLGGAILALVALRRRLGRR